MNEPVAFPVKLAGDTQIALGATGTARYTDAFQFGDVDYFALSYIATCTGTPSIKIEMEQSIVKPAVGNENAADTNFGVPKRIGNIETALVSKTIQHVQLYPVTLPYVRFKLTALAGSPTDIVMNMWLSLQKKFTQ